MALKKEPRAHKSTQKGAQKRFGDFDGFWLVVGSFLDNFLFFVFHDFRAVLIFMPSCVDTCVCVCVYVVCCVLCVVCDVCCMLCVVFRLILFSEVVISHIIFSVWNPMQKDVNTTLA